MKAWLFVLLIFFNLNSACAREMNTVISVQVDSASIIHINYSIPDKEKLSQARLYRAYANFEYLDCIDLNNYAISEFALPPDGFKGEFVDSSAASDMCYYYYLSAKTASGVTYKCNVDSAFITPVILGSNCGKGLQLIIDKPYYTLEACCDGRVLKRYPVNFGRLPRERKLCQDLRTTPEGNYRIAYTKNPSSFYKALGLNYPTAVDSQRYREAVAKNRVPFRHNKPVDIGGAIQIHGGGIGYQNWTYGCIAMRNSDLDELLSLKKSLVGTPVKIFGREVKR